MTFIANHLLLSLLAVVLISAFAGFMVAAILAQSKKRMPTQSDIEPGDFTDDGLHCSWCQKEKAIQAQPHESHSICQRHKAQLLAESKRFGKSEFAGA